MYDATEQTVFDSEIAAAVVGRAGQYQLFMLTDDGPLDEAALELAHARGFGFCGVLAVINGQFAAKCQPDADSVYTMMHAGLAFAHVVCDRLKSKQAGDGVAWLTKLHEMRDPRT